MKTLLVATVAGAAMTMLAGCGQPASTTDPGASTTPPTTSLTAPGKQSAPGTPPSAPSAPVTNPSGADLPAGVALVPATQVDATALPLEYKEHKDVWVFENGHALQMFAMATSGCAGVQATVVSQTADAVRVILRSLDSPQGGPPDGMCTQALEPEPVTVRLTDPLGDRMVYLLSGR